MAYAVLALLWGASVGSFLNLVADRLPAGQSLLWPRSHCPSCGRRLTLLELVPVLSYLALRGRCYRCRARIPLRAPMTELVMGVLALYLWFAYGPAPAAAVLFAYGAILVVLAVVDLEHGIILDSLVYPALVLTLILAPWWHQLGLEREFLGSTSPVSLFLGSLVGGAGAAGFFALVILVYRGMGRGEGMGWGDVKMAGLIGLAAGTPGAAVALLAASVSGGAVAALLLALRLRSRKQSIPFGPFLALGGLVALLWGPPVWDWYLRL